MWVSPFLLALLVFALLVLLKLNYDLSQKESQLGTELTRLRRELDQARASAFDAVRDVWLRELAGAAFNNEVEVEAKLIGPIVRFLGYGPADYRLRVPLRLQAGRQELMGEADWVLYRDGRPFLVIEAKAPGEALTDQVVGQARSYAFGLGAPYYLVVNGRLLRLYELAVAGDRVLLEADVGSLSTVWDDLVKTVGLQRMTDQGT